jgi:hypothetical protein
MTIGRQTTYARNFDLGLAGQIADCSVKNITSHANEEASGVMNYGIGVVRGTDPDKQIKLPSSGVTPIGFTVWEGNRELSEDGQTVSISNKRDLGVMRSGALYVQTEDAVTAGGDVYVRHSGRKQVQTLVLDADFVASNVINGTIGGVAISEVTYASSHANTMALLAAEIQSFAGVETAVVDTRTITITTLLDGVDQTAAGFVITLGASQAGVVVTETASAVDSSTRGQVRSDADSSTAAALTGWAFETSTTAAGIAKIAKL